MGIHSWKKIEKDSLKKRMKTKLLKINKCKFNQLIQIPDSRFNPKKNTNKSEKKLSGNL
mgnify:CR=1 FL=1